VGVDPLAVRLIAPQSLVTGTLADTLPRAFPCKTDPTRKTRVEKDEIIMAGIMPQNPADAAQIAQRYQQLAVLPAGVREFVAQAYMGSQINVLPLPYWSTIRFSATIDTVATPNTATVAATERRAFSYQVYGQAVGAGFASSYTATLADTNLLASTQTRDNADIWIWGLAAQFVGGDPALLRGIWRETACNIALNGTQQIPLGTLNMFPGAGGLYGTENSSAIIPDITESGFGVDGGQGGLVGAMSNGNPGAGNYFRLPQPFKWSALGSAGADSSLIISCTPTHPVVINLAATRAAGTGVAPFTQPTELHCDVQWHLICVAVSKRSVNT